MDQAEARRRVLNGAGILCLDVPPATEWGLDRKIWSVGDSFKGMKMIPPGLHLMTWGAGHETRAGMFLFLSTAEVSVHRWDASLESFPQGGGLSEEEAERYAAGFGAHEFDAHTAPYDLEADGPPWTALTGYLTVELLERCTIGCGTIIVPGDPDAEATSCCSFR